MKKRYVYIILVFMCVLLCGCNGFFENHQEKTIVVDTGEVLEYTDELMAQKGYEIVKRSVSQRTDGVTFFVVEYWFKENNIESHYGFYVQKNDGYYEVIQEGVDVGRYLIE